MAGDSLEGRDSAFSKTHSLVWKPLLYSMRLFGLVLLRPKKRCWSLIMSIYSMIVLITIWANIIRHFFMYAVESDAHGTILDKINLHIWCFFCGVCVSTIYSTGYRHDSFHEFLVTWSRDLQKDVACPHSEKHIQQMRRRVLSCVSISWIAVLINVLSYVYCLINTHAFDYGFAPFLSTNTSFLVIRILLMLPQLYMTAAWTFTLCLFFLLSEVISLQFKDFQQDFRKAIRAEILDLETFRRRHQEICHLVEIADNVLNVFNAAGLVTNTCSGMMILYTIVWAKETLLSDTLVYVWICGWLAVVLLIIMVISYGGGRLNHLAHSPLKVLHDIKLKQVSTKMSVQINMFLTKLTGESIGLTAMDLVVINKPTILTIAGAFITYFIVLIQFQQPLNSSVSDRPACNFTDILNNWLLGVLYLDEGNISLKAWGRN